MSIPLNFDLSKISNATTNQCTVDHDTVYADLLECNDEKAPINDNNETSYDMLLYNYQFHSVAIEKYNRVKDNYPSCACTLGKPIEVLLKEERLFVNLIQAKNKVELCHHINTMKFSLPQEVKTDVIKMDIPLGLEEVSFIDTIMRNMKIEPEKSNSIVKVDKATAFPVITKDDETLPSWFTAEAFGVDVKEEDINPLNLPRDENNNYIFPYNNVGKQ